MYRNRKEGPPEKIINVRHLDTQSTEGLHVSVAEEGGKLILAEKPGSY